MFQLCYYICDCDPQIYYWIFNNLASQVEASSITKSIWIQQTAAMVSQSKARAAPAKSVTPNDTTSSEKEAGQSFKILLQCVTYDYSVRGKSGMYVPLCDKQSLYFTEWILIILRGCLMPAKHIVSMLDIALELYGWIWLRKKCLVLHQARQSVNTSFV